jgi:hypothetical protein
MTVSYTKGISPAYWRGLQVGLLLGFLGTTVFFDLMIHYFWSLK